MPDNKKLNAFHFIILAASIFWTFTGIISPQSKSNLDIFYSLADSTVSTFIHSENPHDSVYTEITNLGAYSVFNNQILGFLHSNQLKAVSEKGTGTPQFLYTIEKASTTYEDIFRDGFLGTYLVKRRLTFKGNYFYTGKGLKEFNLVYSDTVKVDEIKDLENSVFSFTVGTIPAEPFFSGLFEPVAALGTAAAAVILFFTVRGK